MESGGLGYAITPTENPVVVERPAGFTGSEWLPAVTLVLPPIGMAGTAAAALDEHNRIISADMGTNGVVLADLRIVLENAGSRR